MKIEYTCIYLGKNMFFFLYAIYKYNTQVWIKMRKLKFLVIKYYNK